jgi:MFS family permease
MVICANEATARLPCPHLNADMNRADTAPSPPRAIASVILSMGLLAVGNGLLFAYIPVKLAEAGFPPWVAGAAVTAMAAGGLVACLVTGLGVRRVGHARAFGAMTACVILSVLLISLGTLPVVWIVARALYGFAATGLFIISQSWLNDACANQWRGKVIAIFYMVYVLCIGVGGFLLRYLSLEGSAIPLTGIFFATLALLPVSLTRLPAPPPPASITIAVRSVWNISPVGLVGMFAVGGLTMLLQGFGPIYVSEAGYSKADVGLLIFLMQLGLLVVQYPLGALSDRIDRRVVLVVSCTLVVLTALLAYNTDTSQFVLLIIVFAAWTGATESLYSVSNAHANDRADPQYYVSLSSTLLVAWSLSALIIPAITTALIPIFGSDVFMLLSVALASGYGAFVLYRMRHREAPLPEDTGEYQQVSAQVPLTSELAVPGDDPH